MRRAARVDRNQARIVDTLRACGFHVALTHRLGGGFPDLVVTGYHRGWRVRTALLVEVKAEKGTLTDDEERWHGEYPDDGPLIVARSADDVLRWFGATARHEQATAWAGEGA